MANNNNDLVASIRLLVEKLTQERAERPDFAGDMFERLAKVKPPFFKRKVNPTFLENWIREFEKIFGAVNCPKDMRVGQAVLYLKDDADLWWREDGARLSVVEATEELKAQRFEHGLTEEIQLALGGDTFSSLYIVYKRAAHIYGLQSRRDKKNALVGEKRKDFNAGGNQGNFKRYMNGNENFQGRNNQGINNKGQFDRVYHCKNCSNNHPGRDCKVDLVTCNDCQKKGP
ncbi:uncharacterized protein LOC125496643 [Beta vulgaris subsp. vulgaris]|uniref:uncharacterized protein LOC125496643 n=1 Tax=Beta vulgaris subsp. vulgaris TaxID=3555 RepID=UPI002036FADC|nr:uncharacterized protein LOC125496643 [Beta vulgaris subsp. vulgaris]